MQTKHLCVLFHIRMKGLGCYRETSLRPPVIFLLTVSRRYFFCGSFSLFVVVFATLRLFLEALEKGRPLGSLICDVSYVFVTFPFVVMGQVWYLILPIPDLCLLPQFDIRDQVCHACM